MSKCDLLRGLAALLSCLSSSAFAAEPVFSDSLPQFSCSVNGAGASQTKQFLFNAPDLQAATSVANAIVGITEHSIPPASASCRPVNAAASAAPQRLSRFICKVGTIRENVRSFRRSLSRSDEYYEVRARDTASALSVASSLVSTGALGRPLDFAACRPENRGDAAMVYSDTLPLFSCVVGAKEGETRTYRHQGAQAEPERIRVHAADVNAAVAAMSSLIGFDKLIGNPPVSFARCEPVAQVTRPAPPVSASPATTVSTQPGR